MNPPHLAIRSRGATCPRRGIPLVDVYLGIQWTTHTYWLGTSVENQAAADERIPHLLRVPAAVRFLSCEPLLGPVDLRQWLVQGWCPSCNSTCFRFGGSCRGCGSPATPLLHWVIVGGESGPGARPCRVEWIRGIVEQCKAAGVPCFVKQIGSNINTGPHDAEDAVACSIGDHKFMPAIADGGAECVRCHMSLAQHEYETYGPPDEPMRPSRHDY